LKRDNAHLGNYERMLDERAEKMNDAAAFLDRLADQFIGPRSKIAADCRAMAARLRGDNADSR